MKGERDEQTEHHRAGHAAAVVGHWRNRTHGLLGLVSAGSILGVCPSNHSAAANELPAPASALPARNPGSPRSQSPRDGIYDESWLVRARVAGIERPSEKG